jgi:hypothetical protein
MVYRVLCGEQETIFIKEVQLEGPPHNKNHCSKSSTQLTAYLQSQYFEETDFSRPSTRKSFENHCKFQDILVKSLTTSYLTSAKL